MFVIIWAVVLWIVIVAYVFGLWDFEERHEFRDRW